MIVPLVGMMEVRDSATLTFGRPLIGPSSGPLIGPLIGHVGGVSVQLPVINSPLRLAVGRS